MNSVASTVCSNTDIEHCSIYVSEYMAWIYTIYYYMYMHILWNIRRPLNMWAAPMMIAQHMDMDILLLMMEYTVYIVQIDMDYYVYLIYNYCTKAWKSTFTSDWNGFFLCIWHTNFDMHLWWNLGIMMPGIALGDNLLELRRIQSHVECLMNSCFLQ